MRPATHVFHIVFEIPGATEPDEYAVRAYESDELHDVLFGGPDPAGVFEVDFHRAAARFEDAVLDAMDDLQHVFPEAQILEVKPDPLVSLDEIAERADRTHESVRLLVNGKRGPGGFPPPAGGRGRRSKVWRWYEVERWFREELGVDVAGHEHGAFLAAVNTLLELRRVVADAARTPHDARLLASLLPVELADAAAGSS